jgi:hypothetical protein
MTPNQYVAMELQTALEAIVPAVMAVTFFFALGLLLVFFSLLLAMAAGRLSGTMHGERHGRRESRRAGATAGTSFTAPRHRVELPGVMVLEPGRRSRGRGGYQRGRSPGRVLELGA